MGPVLNERRFLLYEFAYPVKDFSEHLFQDKMKLTGLSRELPHTFQLKGGGG